MITNQELHPLTGKNSDCSQWYSSCMLIYLCGTKIKDNKIKNLLKLLFGAERKRFNCNV